MKTIGLVGGATWYSTMDYYRYFNEMIAEECGEFESARLIINSLNYGQIRTLQMADDWQGISHLICKAAEDLEKGGAECILLGGNTMHRVAEDVESKVSIPFIHIAKVTARAIKTAGVDTIALLGTKYTMQLDFFKDILIENGIETMVPNEEVMEKINIAIHEELRKGIILDPTKKMFVEIIDKLAGMGADGVILGSTGIPGLIKTQDCPLPLFDTTRLHAKAGVDFALGKYDL